MLRRLWDGQEQKTKMVKARTESQKSGKQRGCGKKDRGKRESLMKKYRAGGGNAMASMQQTHTFIESWKEQGINKGGKLWNQMDPPCTSQLILLHLYSPPGQGFTHLFVSLLNLT